jgi:polyphosphate kinase
VVVEITARFDEAPNIAWGQYLEREGVHVAYGVEKLKTHVKLALVVREEEGKLRRYLHVGTGNYHSGTARVYEDLGLFTADPDLCEEAAAVFNELTGSTPYVYRHFLIAPHNMRDRFRELIRREAKNAREGRPSGIRAKMNQLQDAWIIRELYEASQAGVPITINVRGLSCLRPGVPGLSENIRVFGVVDRFLEHSRIYRFENAGQPEYYIGSADWMARNLNNRVESIAPVRDAALQRELGELLHTYERDNASVFDCDAEGVYTRRRPKEDEAEFRSQAIFIERARRA